MPQGLPHFLLPELIAASLDVMLHFGVDLIQGCRSPDLLQGRLDYISPGHIGSLMEIQ
jgi:hypothetical protein